MTEHTCEVCKKHFTDQSSRPRRFCSKRCYGDWKYSQETRTCGQCGTAFQTNKGRVKKYCSLKCAAKRKHEAVWEAIRKPKNGCWEARKVRAREAWERYKGRIPRGKLVLHHCDNRRCVRWTPDIKYPKGHLFLGTQKDNIQDMLQKGRSWTQRPRKDTVGIRRKIRKSMLGRTFTPATRAKMSASRLKGIREGRIVVKHSAATRAKIGAASRRWIRLRPEEFAAIRAAAGASWAKYKRWLKRQKG